MKKYEAPIVELTKFDVEDVITTSGGGTTIDTSAITGTAAAEAKAAIETVAADNGLDGVFTW